MSAAGGREQARHPGAQQAGDAAATRARKLANTARSCPRAATFRRRRLSMSGALPPSWRRALLFGGAAVCMAVAPPVAQAREHRKPLTQARFLHAVPMAAPATLIVHGHPPRIHSSYGH